LGSDWAAFHSLCRPQRRSGLKSADIALCNGYIRHSLSR
jgi:hypothetical protein